MSLLLLFSVEVKVHHLKKKHVLNIRDWKVGPEISYFLYLKCEGFAFTIID